MPADSLAGSWEKACDRSHWRNRQAGRPCL